MATTGLYVVESMEEALDVLGKNIVPLNESDFNPLGAYNFTLRSSKPVHLKVPSQRTPDKKEVIPLTGHDNVIINLDFPSQWQLLKLLGPEYGPLEHGTLARQLKAAYHPDGQLYKKNALAFPRWVFTGDVGRRTEQGDEFYRIDAIKPVSTPVKLIRLDTEEPAQKSGDEYEIVLSSKARVLPPSREGYFDQIGNAKGRGYWRGKYFDQHGRSAVWCRWGSVGQGLVARAGRPLDGVSFGVVGTWRKVA